MSETLLKVISAWTHDQRRRKDSSSFHLRTGPWECEPRCHRCQIERWARAAAAQCRAYVEQPENQCGLPEIEFVLHNVLGLPDEGEEGRDAKRNPDSL